MATQCQPDLVADQFGIRADLAERIVTVIEDAIDDGHTTATEVWTSLACDYAHELAEDVELERVIEFVAARHGLTANLT